MISCVVGSLSNSECCLSDLCAVGGPLDQSCRLEGLLGTIEGRGKDLQTALDENRQIEENLRKQIEAELQSEPTHPVISDPPPIEEITLSSSRDHSEASHPTTPIADFHESPYMRTPEKVAADSPALTLPTSTGTTHGCARSPNSIRAPRSPNSIDNSDVHGQSFPGYRRTVSEDDLDQFAFGCGAVFLGQSGIFGDGHQARSDLLPSSGPEGGEFSNLRARSSLTDALMMHATPTLTSSFDGIDFRTGLSGHRALTSATKPGVGSSPTTRSRTILKMSAHRGISRTKPIPKKNSAEESNQPAFAPRFSPFPHSGN